MMIIVALIGISLFIGLCFLTFFIWNYKNGQFENTYSASVKLLFDDKKPADSLPTEPRKNKKKKHKLL